MDPQAHHEFRKYTCPDIAAISWDPQSGRHIPFRASLRHRHATWARTNFSLPELYIQPETLEEIRLAVDLARRCSKQIVVVGSGHSPSDITCTRSWMVNLDRFSSVVSEGPEKLQITVEAGIRLFNLTAELEKRKWAMPNLGSITSQSIAGAIATSTHGSSLRHGLISESVAALTVMLSNGKTVVCSRSENKELFSAALVHLGAIGIITHVTFQAVPAFNVYWEQEVVMLPKFLSTWNKGVWTQSEFVRCWWFPYSNRTIVWHASKTDLPLRDPPKSWYGAGVGRFSYELLLYIARWIPSVTPFVERYVFNMQYGWDEGKTGNAVQKNHEALTMDCLFSQLVNEWAIPLEKGPEAIERLDHWLNGRPELSRIPFSPAGIYVHAPIEVRVSDSTHRPGRPWLDQSMDDGPTLYLNATLYRPFLTDLPTWKRYYQAFEWLMKELGGRPHWAKNFITAQRGEFWDMYPNMNKWVKLRNQVDPTGVFVTEWHKRNILGGIEAEKAVAETSMFKITCDDGTKMG